MKILSAKQIRAADAQTIATEPISSLDLMERASLAAARWILANYSRHQSVCIVCGTGNNGGDGMAIARLLFDFGFKVNLFSVAVNENASKDYLINRKRLPSAIRVRTIDHENELPLVHEQSILVDALFGSGLSRPLEGLYAKIVLHLNNQQAAAKISIDIASGLFADSPRLGAAFQPDFTLSFQLPKLAFFAPENATFVGQWIVLPIGLNQHFIDQCESNYHTITKSVLANYFPERKKFAHKGSFGHLLLIAASKGKVGASVLAARAALRAGVGLLTTHLPGCAYGIMQATVSETMVSTDRQEALISTLPDLAQFQAIAIGPGLGKAPESAAALEQLLQQVKGKPMVVDADALNLLAENSTLINLLPKGCILTPHPGEFKRLFGDTSNSFENWELQADFSKKHEVTIVLKGAHTSISLPSGELYFNTSGNAGMATGGSGDVLTGIIGSLLAQGVPAEQAALLGVFVHGLAADLAVQKIAKASLLPSDIIEMLGKALLELKQ